LRPGLGLGRFGPTRPGLGLAEARPALNIFEKYKVILINFVTKYKKEYKRVHFGVLDVCNLLLFFVLENMATLV
jgi:hypothetical protein